MDAQPKTSTVAGKTLLLLFVLVVITIFLMKAPPTQSVALGQTERVFENAIPENAPIRIKIKKEKEKSFKDLKDGKWIRDFELELTNTGDRPIYFLYVTLISDVKVDDQRLVFPLVYGRAELGDIISKALPDDMSIKPGDTYVFKIHPGQVPAWEQSVQEKSHPEATRLRAELQSLSFGDGTGYFGNDPYPPANKAHTTGFDRRLRANPARPPRAWPSKAGTQHITSSILDMPVTFLPANFLASMTASNIPTAVLAADGCLFDECIGIIPSPPANVCYNCPLQNRPTFDSGGVCRELRYDKIECLFCG